MYCQSCGTQLTKGLTYCNRCGARVGPDSPVAKKTDAATAAACPPTDKLGEALGWLATATGFTVCGGFALVYFLATRLMGLGFDQSRVLIVTFFCLAAVVGISALLINQLSRVLNAFLRAQSAGNATTDERSPEVVGRDTAQIEAPREPATSVTDHTTRTFDPAYVERGQRQG